MKCRKPISLILCVMMIVPMITVILPTAVSAVRYPADLSNRYRIKVFWNVVSANEKNDNNYFFVRIRTPEETDNTNIDGCYLSQQKYTKNHASDETGSYTYSFETCGYPEEIYYSCCGRSANPSEWYVTKITITVLDPVVGEGTETTYWEGKLGLRIASFGGNSTNTASIVFNVNGYEHYFWDNTSIGTNQTIQTTTFAGTPKIAGVTGVDGPSEIAVPTDGGNASYSYTRGVVYDSFGAKWPVQGSDSADIRQYVNDSYVGGNYFSHEGFSFSNNTATLTSAANAANDYKFMIFYEVDSSRDHWHFKPVTVKTFDYNVIFKDAYGNVLKTETVDYGGSATPPNAPEATIRDGHLYPFVGWSGDSYENVKDGVQDHVVTAAYGTESAGYLLGSGTSDDPYRISDTSDWYLFQLYCYADATSGKYFRLDSDISLSESDMAGKSNYDFQGTFDGNGHTLTLSIGSQSRPVSTDYAAPFAYTKNAAIENLHTAGKIYTSGKYAGGIVGGNWGSSSTNIINCRSSVEIISSTVGDGRHGGLVGLTNDSGSNGLHITGCVFDGKLLGSDTTGCSGLVGYRLNSRKLYIRNSIFAPSEVTVSDTDSAIFARNTGKTIITSSKITATNSYYLYEFGSNLDNWTEGHTISAAEGATVGFSGSSTTYSVSGITAYEAGLEYNGNMYAGNEEEVEVTLNHSDAPTGYRFSDYSASAGTLTRHTVGSGSLYRYSLTMPDEDVVISAVNEIKKYTVIWKNYDGTVLETDTNVPHGSDPAYDGATPTKEGDGFIYTFAGWSPELSPVTAGVTYTAQFTSSPNPDHMSVSGDTYTILDSDGWSVFCALLADSANNGLYGKKVELAADINVSRMAGVDSDHAFRGVFDGNRHKITVDIPNDSNGTVALFGYVNKALIEYLVVDGSITGSGNHAAVLAGEAVGDGVTEIIDCKSSATISGGTYVGGFTIGGHFNLRGCVFDGRINATGKSGGFIGWGENDTEITNCVFAPQDGSSIVGGTFYYTGNGGVTVTNSYYVTLCGTAQGKKAYTISGGENVSVNFKGIPAYYTTGGLRAYSFGIKYDGTMYAGEGNSVELNLGHNDFDGYDFTGYTVSAGTLDGDTLTMPAQNVTVNAVYSEAATVCGDATGDGAIDTADIILIAQYILDNATEISAQAADVTGDGAVDTADIILIAQYILDNSVVLGPQS